MNDKCCILDDLTEVGRIEAKISQMRLNESLTLPTPEEARELVRKKNKTIDNAQLLKIIEAIKDADKNYIIYDLPSLRPNVRAKLEGAGYIISSATNGQSAGIRRLKIIWGE